MADKTWMATDLKLGALKITPRNGEIHIERRYVFLDEFDEVLTQIVGGRVVGDFELASLPTEILSALQAINTWTKNQALAQEGMLD